MTSAAGAPVLVGDGLVKRFGATTALAGVGFQVHRAESVAIMGPSGSGKSTLLHCLAGILRPDEGSVTLDGKRIDGLGEAQRSVLRRTRFGFVFQFGQLLPELPAVENVALPLMLDGVPRRTAVARAASWFGPLGLTGLEQRRPGELSGGQAQRVAIARALICEPAVVFADEPTGSLDQTTGADTLRLLTEATRRQGACLVMVTHDPTVAGACDRVIEVRDGLIRGGDVAGRGAGSPGLVSVRGPVGAGGGSSAELRAPVAAASANPGGLPARASAVSAGHGSSAVAAASPSHGSRAADSAAAAFGGPAPVSAGDGAGSLAGASASVPESAGDAFVATGVSFAAGTAASPVESAPVETPRVETRPAEFGHRPEPTVTFSPGRVSSGAPAAPAPASSAPQWPVDPTPSAGAATPSSTGAAGSHSGAATPSPAVPSSAPSPTPSPTRSESHNEQGARLW